MGFYLKKGIKASPFRFNLSKSGIGNICWNYRYTRRNGGHREITYIWVERVYTIEKQLKEIILKPPSHKTHMHAT